MSYETLQLTREQAILTVAIAREKSLNSLSVEVLSDLRTLLLAEGDNLRTRGIIITGEGERAFISGADIAAMKKMTQSEGGTFCELGQEVSTLFEAMPFPVIACVHGYALGGGCEMAMSCDQIFATRSAVFGQPEVLLGLIPGFGGCVRLVNRVGISKAKELIFSGQKISASEAEKIGLVDQVFGNKEEAMAAARNFLLKTIPASPTAIAACKRAIHASLGETITSALDRERREFVRVFSSGDRSEGIKAFLEKRRPEFGERCRTEQT